MSNFPRLVLAFVRRDFYIATSYKFNFVFQLTAGFFAIAFFYFISRLIGSEASRSLAERFQTDYFSYVLIGVAAAGFLHTGLAGFAESLRTGMTEGSLEMTFACPVRPIWILVLPCIWAFFFEALKALVVVGFGVAVFGADMGRANLPAGAVVLLFTITSYSVFGLLSASVIMLLKKGDVINVAFAAASSLIAGAYFPIELLPPWLAAVAMILPMTYAYEGLRGALLSGAGVPEVFPQLAVLAGFSIVGLPLAIGVANAAISRAKRSGTLGVF
jgi:ABC-2 type transport system permease protein